MQKKLSTKDRKRYITVMTIEEMPIKKLKLLEKNPRRISAEQMQKLCNSLQDDPEFLQKRPVLVNKTKEDYHVYAGNQRVRAAKKLKWETVPCIIDEDLDPKIMKARIIKDNKTIGEFDYDILANNYDPVELIEWGFTPEELSIDPTIIEGEKEEKNVGFYLEAFGNVPFSIWDTRSARWQIRSKYWKNDIGIQDDDGRKENLTFNTGGKFANISNTSTFDAVVTETIINWFCEPNGTVLDPFCGGLTRGSITWFLNRKYIGFDVRKEQIDSNEKLFEALSKPKENITTPPHWIHSSSENIPTLITEDVDFIFSCPPYGNLETYSDQEDDLSNKGYDEFKKIYYEIIGHACEKLKNNSFATFVVGDFRNKKGHYQNFVAHTIEAFEKAGLKLYNEIIMVVPCGTLPVRTKKPFVKSRKIGKHHQNILIFIKGDPVLATKKLSDANFEVLENEEAL